MYLPAITGASQSWRNVDKIIPLSRQQQARLNKCVFSCFLKHSLDGDCLSPRGREFQRVGAIAEKARSSYVLSRSEITAWCLAREHVRHVASGLSIQGFARQRQKLVECWCYVLGLPRSSQNRWKCIAECRLHADVFWGCISGQFLRLGLCRWTNSTSDKDIRRSNTVTVKHKNSLGMELISDTMQQHWSAIPDQP